MRRKRLSRWLRWVGIIACVLILLAAIGNLRWVNLGVEFGGDLAVVTTGGALWIEVGERFPARLSDLLVGTGPRLEDWQHAAGFWRAYAGWPRSYSDLGHNAISIPLWMFLAAIGVPTTVAWYRDRRPPRGHCQRCGYDLTGNVSGRCSECGAEKS